MLRTRFRVVEVSLIICAAVACQAEPPAPTPARVLLEVENARAEDVSPLVAALSAIEPDVQMRAVRALGRLARVEHGPAVLSVAASPDARVRRAAATALGDMRFAADLSSWLERESDAGVRGAIHESIGRIAPIDGVSEVVLARGLADADLQARSGAAHGLEALLRLNRNTLRPTRETVAALRRAAGDQASAEIRELALLALAAAGDKDRATLELALRDPEPQVRRLAVIALATWIDDPSPIVRYDALRVAPTCERATAALADASGHVVLLAVDLLGTLPCAAATIEPLLAPDRPWRVRAHAIVSLARVAPEAARRLLPSIASDPVWQARAYAAAAAKLAGHEATRAALAADSEPNVVIAAMTSPQEAIRALGSNHRGLLIEAANLLEGATDRPEAVPALVSAFVRLSAEDRPTSRDARLALLARLHEATLDAANLRTVSDALRPALADRDPAVAARVAEVLTKQTGTTVSPSTPRYADDSLPPEDFIAALEGATARITMKGLGAFTIELLVDEAPATAALFAQHAEAGGYDRTTLHRVVPNFVLQGGSHGANEYDGAVGPFMRDELGFRHLRGTLGISTRGPDTGDGQIFVNLVDNFRLDHRYTVFARVTTGMDVVDRVLEGDVIESVRIRRR